MESVVVISVLFKGERIQTHLLRKPLIVIGRDPAADVFLDNIGVSRQHAVVELGVETVCIRDLSSVNGTFVNGVPCNASPSELV